MARYVTLMASLPPIGELFASQQTPISQLKLENRLKLLEPEDRQLLSQIMDLVSWAYQPMERTDAEFVALAERFFQETSRPTLREVVGQRLELRTIIAALRRRHRGEKAPPAGQMWGWGNWVSYIERHWHEPAFRLQGMFPWVPEAESLLAAGDSVGLERLQFQVNWQMLERLSLGHYFDFEAVAIYLMRWSLADRWSRYDGEAAVQRFRQLVAGGKGKFAPLF